MKNGTNIQNLGKKNQTEREGKFNLKSDANQSLTVRSIDRIPPPLNIVRCRGKNAKNSHVNTFLKVFKICLGNKLRLTFAHQIKVKYNRFVSVIIKLYYSWRFNTLGGILIHYL